MRFEWSDEKNSQNLAKHGISFELAQLVFEDPLHVSAPEVHDAEERWRTIGMIGNSTIVVVAHTLREAEENDEHEEVVRIISARKATRQEREQYEEAQ